MNNENLEIFNDLSWTDFEESNIIFDELFDNRYDNKSYILTGDIGLWDGVRRGVHHPDVFNSLKDAILEANSGFNGYITVSEAKYGRLYVDVAHHDGHNTLEIRELTKLGEEMHNSYKDVRDILHRKGATRNVKYTKRYRWDYDNQIQ